MKSRGVLLAALSGISIAVAFTGASRALVTAHAVVVAAFGITCLWFAIARRGCVVSLLTAWCIGACSGAALRPGQPVSEVVSRAPHAGEGSDLFALLDKLDSQPGAVIGRRVRVSGTWTPAQAATPASVSQRIMACCAADAIDVGFDVRPQRNVAVPGGSSVCVDGTLAARMRGGELRYEIARATVRATRCSGR